jgi:pimeloyl-ACP methyl ester carboxylesterase
MSELSADVIALADAAGVERFDVIGHDWGAAVAWDLAATRPDRVRTLVALSTPHPRAFADSLVRSNQLLHSWYMLFFQLPALPEALIRSAGAKPLVKDGLDPETARRYASRFAERGAMTGPLNWYRALPFSLGRQGEQVSVPTLYVWSDGDRYLSRYAADRTARYVKGPYRFEVLEGMSHWLPTAAADRLAPMVIEHLAAFP